MSSSSGVSKRKDSLSRKKEVKEKLVAGEFKTAEPDVNLKSAIWTVFKPVIDSTGNTVNFVCCSICGEL